LLLSPGGKSGEFEDDEGVAHPHHLQIRPSSGHDEQLPFKHLLYPRDGYNPRFFPMSLEFAQDIKRGLE